MVSTVGGSMPSAIATACAMGIGCGARVGAKNTPSEMSCKPRPAAMPAWWGHGGIISPVGRPLGDDETGEGLQTERGAHVEDAERGFGTARDLLGEVARQDGKAQD